MKLTSRLSMAVASRESSAFFGKFDREKNVKFASRCQALIRGAILDSLREMDWSPRDLRRDHGKWIS
jgi:hypothetical protein